MRPDKFQRETPMVARVTQADGLFVTAVYVDAMFPFYLGRHITLLRSHIHRDGVIRVGDFVTVTTGTSAS